MDILQSLLLGVVEGLTEFLPISSTFHLITASRIMGLPNSDFVKLYEVVIQSGAIVAVLFLYAQSFFQDRSLITKVILSFLPTAGVGLLFHSVIKQIFFESMWLMLAVFAGVGVIFLLVEQSKLFLSKNCESLTLREALLIGFTQALAVIPGVSRSGAVIVTMMLLGYKRDQAAKYTFYLSLPTIIAAGALDLYQGRELLTSHTGSWLILGVGFFTALLVALFIIKWLIHYLSTHTLAIFGWYRIVLALIILFATVAA